MDFDGEVAENPGRHDIPTLSFENAATPTGNQVMFVSQTHTATTTMSIVYANANDAQSSAIYSGCGDGGDVNMTASPSNDYDSSNHHFDWDRHMGNYVIQEFADPTMQTLVEPTMMDVKQGDCVSPSPSQPQYTGYREGASSTLPLEKVPMTYQDTPEMGLRQFEYIPPEMMACAPDNSATMTDTFPNVFVTEPHNYSSSFACSGWNGSFTDSLTSPQNDAYPQVPPQRSSASDHQKVYCANLPLLESENINSTRNRRLLFNTQPEFQCQSRSVMNMQEHPSQREMNDADNDDEHHRFLTQVYDQVLQSIKAETEDETNIAVGSQETPPGTQTEMVEANGAPTYSRILESIKEEMEDDSNIAVEHLQINMQENSPQREMYQASSFPEPEYNQDLESVKVELGKDTNFTVEHQSPMHFDFSGTPPLHPSSQQAPLGSQEILGTFATFDIGDSSDNTRENLFIAPTPYSPQIQVNSPNGSYSDSGFSSSQFSSQEVFSSQENDNMFTTKELNEAYDEVDGSPPMEQSGAPQNVSVVEVYYDQPVSVPVPTADGYYRCQDENANTSDEDEEAQASTKRCSRKASKRCRDSRPSGRRVAGTSNSECGSSDGDSSTGRPATQRLSSRGSQRVRRVRVKDDVSSFRHQMGPHLRTLSAVLEMSGLKMVHELVPYEVIRRFHPTDVYRTIARSVNFMENVGSGDSSTTTTEPQPDWEKFVAESNGGRITTQEPSNDRIYYKSPFGRPEDEGEKDAEIVIISPKEPCTLSIRNEVEIDGRVAQSPEVKTGVGSAELNVQLNLHKVAERCSNVEFKQSELYDKPLIMRLKNPQSMAVLYDTGKLIVIGTKSYEEFRVAARKYARMVQKTGVDIRLTQLKMHFYIGLFILPFDVNVNAMKSNEYLSKFIMHDISIFPGVIIKLPNNPMLCLVFETGAVIFTNAVQISDMKETLDMIYPTLRLFGHQH